MICICNLKRHIFEFLREEDQKYGQISEHIHLQFKERENMSGNENNGQWAQEFGPQLLQASRYNTSASFSELSINLLNLLLLPEAFLKR